MQSLTKIKPQLDQSGFIVYQFFSNNLERLLMFPFHGAPISNGMYIIVPHTDFDFDPLGLYYLIKDSFAYTHLINKTDLKKLVQSKILTEITDPEYIFNSIEMGII